MYYKFLNDIPMKKLVTIIAIISLACAAQGQQGFFSNDNAQGDWSSASTWTKSARWLPNTPGNPVRGAAAYVDVYGTVSQFRDLIVAGGSTVTVYDTLIINGDLILRGGGVVVVETNGVLVVRGRLNGSGGTVTTNEGRAVVTENLTIVGGADIINNATGSNAFYLYGTPSRSGGARFNGSRNPAASNFKSETELENDDPTLYSLVNGGTLPVEFLYAKAQADDDHNVIISWATASEINNDYFVVERSSDGVNYSLVGKVEGAGNSDHILTYEFMDRPTASGTFYYRVKQVDFDGQYDYSEIATATVENDMPLELSAYPNPTSGPITLNIFGGDNNAVKIVVRSMHGEVKKVIENAQQSVVLDLSSFPKGYYFMEAYYGQKKEILKVILN